MAADDVSLTDLEVTQQFSLAVRGAVASRATVVAALEADLARLTCPAARLPVAPASRRTCRAGTARPASPRRQA